MKKLITIILVLTSGLIFSQGATSDLQRQVIAAINALSSNTVAGLALDNNAALRTSGVSKASTGFLYGYYGTNTKTSSQFILFYNSTTVPADGTAPFIAGITVPANSSFSFNFPIAISFGTGISWSNSSTLPTKTIGAADVQMTVIYK